MSVATCEPHRVPGSEAERNRGRLSWFRPAMGATGWELP